MQNLGVIIGRFSPLHIGHISLIKHSLNSFDKTIVIIGSADKVDDKNPYSLNERKEFLKKEFGNEVILDYLDDSENDDEWIFNLTKVLKKYSNNNDFINFLGGDLGNDYAIKIIKEYLNDFNFTKISFLEKSRLEIPISATKVRSLLKDNNTKEVKKWISKKTLLLIIK